MLLQISLSRVKQEIFQSAEKIQLHQQGILYSEGAMFRVEQGGGETSGQTRG